MEKVIKFFHGTSMENAEKIIKEGFSSNDTIWNCSDCDYTYVAESNCDEEEYNINYDEGFYLAVEAAQIAAAYFNSMKSETVVFEFLVPEEIANEFEDDISCENMAQYHHCYQIDSKFLNDCIRTGKIRVIKHTLKNAYNPNLRVFVLPKNNKYLNKIDDLLIKQAMELVKDIWLDDFIGYYDEDITEEIDFSENKVS